MLLVFLLFLSTYATHITVVLDTVVAKRDVELEKNTRIALLHAFDRYILPQDKITVYTFDSLLLDGVSGNARRLITDTIMHKLEFKIGCANWDAALRNVIIGLSNDIYLITDENPCGADPTAYATVLLNQGIRITAVGIGPDVDRLWLTRVSSPHSAISLSGYTYLLQNGRENTLRGHGLRDTVSTPVTGWEIAAAVIVGTVIVILIINSCIYACRSKIN